MEINNFSELTVFFYTEYDKMADSFGIVNPSKSFIKFVEKNLKKYSKLYSKPLLRQSKRELQLKVALETMPHSFVWRICHKKLWLKCKEILNETKNKGLQTESYVQEVAEAQILVPKVVKPMDTPVLSDTMESSQG